MYKLGIKRSISTTWFPFLKAQIYVWIEINYVWEKVKYTRDTALRKTTMTCSGLLLQPILLYFSNAVKACFCFAFTGGQQDHGCWWTIQLLIEWEMKLSCHLQGRMALVLLRRAEKPARQLAESISLWSVPPLVAECQGEVTLGETASVPFSGRCAFLPFTKAHCMSSGGSAYLYPKHS